MSPILVWRFEDPDGVGPFYELSGSLDAWDRITAPSEDGLGFLSGWRYGFASRREALHAFTPSDRVLMEAHNITLGRFMVPAGSIKWGRHQVAFIREDSIKIHES